jgi:excisionase family DNA binding protein
MPALNPEQSPEPLLTASEVAALIRVSDTTFRQLARAGNGPACVRIGCLVRYPADGVTAWIASLPRSQQEG